MRKYLMIAILAAGTLATSCKDKVDPVDPKPTPEPKCAFTLTSETFDNHRFLISDDAVRGAAFDAFNTVTVPQIIGPTSDGKYKITIEGEWDVNPADNFPKTLTFSDKNSLNISIEGIHSTTDTVYLNLSSQLTQGSVTITKYGEVGQNIEGTFQGVFDVSGGLDATIKDGKFVVKRDPNL